MSAELLLKHLAEVADSPDSVPALRRFILDMAVRGKLVPQNPKDEPAAVLLERIEAEKRKLEKAGKLKPAKPLPPLTDEEKPFGIPDSWEWVKLDQVTDNFQPGFASGARDQSGVIQFRMNNVTRNGNVDWSKITRVPIDKKQIERCSVVKDDILFNNTNSAELVGKTALFEGYREPVTFSNHFTRIKVGKSIIPQYLTRYLQERRESGFFKENCNRWIGQASISKEKLYSLLTPLPPLAEQKRIIARVNELMMICDKLEAALSKREQSGRQVIISALEELKSPPKSFAKSARVVLSQLTELTARPEYIKELRRAILDMAVRGQLVRQNPKDEPATALLEKIEAEKCKLEKAGEIKPADQLSPLADEEKPFDIPVGWEWCYFADIVSFTTGKTPQRSESKFWDSSDYPWFSISDMIHGKCVYKTKEGVSEHAKNTVMPNITPAKTIIMSFKLTIGKISRLAIPAFHNEGIISIYPHFRDTDSYLFIFLPSLAQYGTKKGAVKGMTLNNKSLSKLLIPLPPLAEQKRIAAKVDELMAICDKLETTLSRQEQNRHHALDALISTTLAGISVDV